MPVFRQHKIFELARGVKAFLKLEVGLTRAGAAAPGSHQRASSTERGLEHAGRLPGDEERKPRGLQAELNKNGIGRIINPENVVWIFGDGRSGTTWLSAMMGDMKRHAVWREPNVGFLFGHFYYVWAHEGQRGTRNFILGRHRESWLNSIRGFILNEAQTRFPVLSGGDYLVIKEPNGSVGAPLMMEALPESRMVLLVRDPRDVVASALDAHRIGSWSYKRTKGAEPLAEEDPDAFVAHRAERYLRNAGNSKLAYDNHWGPKALIRYEELRADTPGEMKRMYSELGIPVDEEELTRAVERHSWENVPEEEKGEGKFYRKATPGGWREDLTPEQTAAVERITAPLLKELYPSSSP